MQERIDKETTRLDKLDLKEDQKIQIDEKDYSNTYLKRVKELVGTINLMKEGDKEKSELKKELLEALKDIDKKNIESQEANFNEQLSSSGAAKL